MPKGTSTDDTAMLSMALVGYEAEKKKIEQKIAELKGHIGGRSVSPLGKVAKRVGRPRKDAQVESAMAPVEQRQRKPLSSAARKRIAIAQKKRWAEHRKREAAAAKE